MERLTDAERAALEREERDPGVHMHDGAVFVFGGAAPTEGDILARIGPRSRDLPRLRMRLSYTGGETSWTPASERRRQRPARRARLGGDADDAELVAWAGHFFARRLDRRRPLWEMMILPGLARGRWALAVKTHRALTREAGPAGLLARIADERAGGPPATAMRLRLPAPAGLRGTLGQARDVAAVRCAAAELGPDGPAQLVALLRHGLQRWGHDRGDPSPAGSMVSVDLVPGPAPELRLFRSPLLETFTIPSLRANSGLAIAVTRDDARHTLCFTADRHLVPDLAALALGLAASIDGLEAHAPTARASSSISPPPTASPAAP